MDLKQILLPWDSIDTTSTTDAFFPVTSWYNAGGLEKGRASWAEMSGRFGNFSAIPAYQTCCDPRHPDAAVALPLQNGVGAYMAADGTYDPDPAGASNLAVGGKRSIRFGWILKSTAGVGGARVSAIIDILT